MKMEESFFFKDRNPFETEKNYFLNYSKQKNQRSFNQVRESLKKHFQNYVCVEPLRVISESAPFFITSGIQRYNPQFEGDARLQIPPELQIQPVIRTNYRESAGELELPEEHVTSGNVLDMWNKMKKIFQQYISE